MLMHKAVSRETQIIPIGIRMSVRIAAVTKQLNIFFSKAGGFTT